VPRPAALPGRCGPGAILDRVTGTDEDPTATLDPATPGTEALPEPVPAPEPDVAPAPVPRRRPAGRRRRRVRRRLRRWARGPGGRFVVPLLALAVLLTGTAAAGRYLVPATAPVPAPVAAAPSPTPSGIDLNTLPTPAPDGADPTIEPTPSSSTEPSAAPSFIRPQDTLAAWARRMSPAVGIPVVALQAYGYAQLRAEQTQPNCHLSWTTLAGIGEVESDHGRADGAVLLPDGRALPPIIGEPLDGTGGRGLVRDTDHGLLDGDPLYDRAVGPMQFIPGTWTTYQVDADGDGASDPNDINDAALAAADYLCASNRDLSDALSWWSAVLSYNALHSYAMDVFQAANNYGTRSRTVA
jgi:membrane-bound lytic murein transglycosylase B